MRNDTNGRLSQLLLDLESAINQAVENPLLFVDSPLLHALGSSCRFLTDLGEDIPGASPSPAIVQEQEKRSALLWQVRARAGRLQMLLDSAAQFYSCCFSPSQAEGMAYGVHGEWSAAASPSHLLVDC